MARWPPRPIDWEPPAELVEFLEAGPPPVFVGFGSTTEGMSRRAEFSEIVNEALRRYGGRAVVQAGWLQLDVGGDNLAAYIAGEDGAGAAVKAIEAHLGTR
ncbi:hypothetical protein [Nocardia sp. NPDC059239]|uniref:hypothetical protein n=1 Tax=unclassified Nocardia TaxID=2637762 RepID=UPI003681435C